MASTPVHVLAPWPSFEGPHNLSRALGWYLKPAKAPRFHASLLPPVVGPADPISGSKVARR